MNLKQIRQELEQRKGRKKQLQEELDEEVDNLRDLRRRARRAERAKLIVQEVAKETQAELRYHITEPVDLALEAVFGKEAYKLGMDFNISGAGRMDIPLFFERDGWKADPMDSTGYGQVDVAAYALGISMMSLKNSVRPGSVRMVKVMDEPFKNPDRTVRPQIWEMVRGVSHSYGIQHIIITHDPALIEVADRVFRVVKKGKGCIVEVEK